MYGCIFLYFMLHHKCTYVTWSHVLLLLLISLRFNNPVVQEVKLLILLGELCQPYQITSMAACQVVPVLRQIGEYRDGGSWRKAVGGGTIYF